MTSEHETTTELRAAGHMPIIRITCSSVITLHNGNGYTKCFIGNCHGGSWFWYYDEWEFCFAKQDIDFPFRFYVAQDLQSAYTTMRVWKVPSLLHLIFTVTIMEEIAVKGDGMPNLTVIINDNDSGPNGLRIY